MQEFCEQHFVGCLRDDEVGDYVRKDQRAEMKNGARPTDFYDIIVGNDLRQRPKMQEQPTSSLNSL